MNYKILDKKFKTFTDLITSNKVIEAIDIFNEIIINDKNEENINEFEEIKTTYFSMLKYSVSNVSDTQRDKIYNSLLKLFLDLSDKVKASIYTHDAVLVSYAEKRKIQKFALTLSNKINYITSKVEISEVEKSEHLNEIFNIALFTDKYKEDEISSLQNFYKSDKIGIHDKSVILSAITLGLLRCFDFNKILLLAHISELDEKSLKLRALIGLVFGLYQYNDRLKFYPEIENRLKILFDDKEYSTYFEIIIIQLIKSKETEQIVQKLHKEIIPEMMKITPKINSKLNLDTIISESLAEDKNPDWEEIFEDAPNMLDKMQELSELQIEGSDVLMGTFSSLKFFPFFKQLKNWFTPFYKENPELNTMFSDNEHKEVYLSVAKGLEKSAYMCNSDKYSFFLNIGNLPAVQKNMIINLFKIESEAMNEIKQDDLLLNKNIENKEIITQYLQDLYRFFKIHPDRKEFVDFFSFELDLYRKKIFEICIHDIETYKNIAELYFKKNYYNDAINVFEILIQKSENRPEIFEKIGYSYQRLLNFNMALEYYKKAELFDVNKLWINKKIAFCYLKLEDYQKSLEYYLKVEKEDEKDLHTQTNIGLCYLNSEDYQNALKYYFKVEYFSPSNIKVLRPIAWCSFVLGKIETAIKYYKKLLEVESTKYDYLNLGHSFLSSGNKTDAIVNYKISLSKYDDKSRFFTDFEEDFKYLVKNNISVFDLNLICEYLKVYDTFEN